MSDPKPPLIQVIGLGNRWRRDDGVGLAVAETLARLSLDRVEVELCDGGPLSLLDRFAQSRRVILVDAVHAPPGICRVHRLDAPRALLKPVFPASSHGLGLVEAIELAGTLGVLPEETVVYGVEGWDFSYGEGLSSEAEAAARACLRAILADIPARCACGGLP